MPKLKIPFHGFDIEAMKTLSRVRRKISERDLPIQRLINLLEKRVKADWRS